jgi:hypothetical protein
LFSLEINVAPLVIQMTRRFSQMLMAFLFPSKTQNQTDIHQQNNPRSTKPPTKHATSTSFKRRTRSAEVRIYPFFFLRNKQNSGKRKGAVRSILLNHICIYL